VMDVSRTINCDSYWDAMCLESVLQQQGVNVRRPDDGLTLVVSGGLDTIVATVAEFTKEFRNSSSVVIQAGDRDSGPPQQSAEPPPAARKPTHKPLHPPGPAHRAEPARSNQPRSSPGGRESSRAIQSPSAPKPSPTPRPYSGGCDPGAGEETPIEAAAPRYEMETARLARTADAARAEPDRPATRQRAAAGALDHELNPLQRLIHQRLREQGWSYGEVARRGGVPRSTIYTLATTRNLARPPRPATLDGLAKGLDVPASAVRAAAAESTGLHYYDEIPAARGQPDDPERELLIASIDELTPEDRRHVAALVESLRKRASPSLPEG
jgi:transcriptional regulator with XRE-family HTH domain